MNLRAIFRRAAILALGLAAQLSHGERVRADRRALDPVLKALDLKPN